MQSVESDEFFLSLLYLPPPAVGKSVGRLPFPPLRLFNLFLPSLLQGTVGAPRIGAEEVPFLFPHIPQVPGTFYILTCSHFPSFFISFFIHPPWGGY